MYRGSKTEEVFLQLCDDAWEISRAVVTNIYYPSACRKYGYEDFLDMQSAISRKERQRALQELERSKIVRLEKKGSKSYILLTDEGKQELLKKRIIYCDDLLPKGQVCLVSFDIPEHVKIVRQAFRSFLRSSGFQQMHRSVWQSRKNVCELMRFFVKKMKMTQWVSVYSAYKM